MRARLRPAAWRRPGRRGPAAPRGLIGLVALAGLAARAGAGTGDVLCDPARSTPDTCVIVGTRVVGDGSVLSFDAPNVRVDGTIQVAFSGHCGTSAGPPCASDAACGPGGRCLRSGSVELGADGRLTVSRGARIRARGTATAGDTIGPDGGSIRLVARDVTIAGLVTVEAEGRPGVPAGGGGAIAIDAAGTATVEGTGVLDASTPSGGCGGSVLVGASVVPSAVDLRGRVSVEGATSGGRIQVAAGERVTVDDELEASNTNSNAARRERCTRTVGGAPTDALGGGSIDLRAGRVALTGRLRARGKEAPGGTVRLIGELDVTVDTAGPTPAVSVLGGQVDALFAGGTVVVVATAGDVNLRRGTIESDGQTFGVGSDAGDIQIAATSALRCAGSGAPCSSLADCALGEACVDRGGNVLVAAGLSARGGAGRGFGCFFCEIRGTGNVTVSGPVDVGGGAVSGAGGELEIVAGGDLSVGPAGITSTGADAGSVTLIAGERFPDDPAADGVLRIGNGTPVRADGVANNGVGGEIILSACDVTVEANAHLSGKGGADGNGGSLLAVAREQLHIEPLARFNTLPDGDIELRYRLSEDVAADAVFQPSRILEQDATLQPCVACGNGRVEPPEACDGFGSCPLAGQVCVRARLPGECTCIDTCGTVPGIQPGEQCDGSDLGGRTCVSEGFPGGTLSCAADCALDRSACLGAICGDGIVGPDERCDVGGIGGVPPSFAGATCATLGFPGGGGLVCAPRCAAIVTVPHCSRTVTLACKVDADCPASESCVAGCFQCGNEFLDPGEECDAGAENSDSDPDTCRNSCTLPFCGDDVVDTAAGEDCDDGPDTGPDRPCTEECRAAACGDGRTCAGGSCTTGPGGGPEQCDDGNLDLGDGCGTDAGGECALSGCGNGILDEPEECDDGNRENDDGCDVNCTLPRCGNGIVNRGEECDPPSSCCSAGCLVEGCDDGNVCTVETCDPVAGCVVTPSPGRPCNDGNACTTGEVCTPAGECAGTPLACETGDFCRLASCDPAAGCQFTRRGGFVGLRCLPAQELEQAIDALGARLGRAEMRRLRSAAARITRRLRQASVAGPGRVALQQLRKTRRGIAGLVARLQRLRRKGRLEPRVVQSLASQAGELSAGIAAVIAELRP